jgi:hypothetical protein
MIARVEEIFRAYCDSCGIAWDSQWAGRHVVLLQIEQRARVLREVEGSSLTMLGKEEIIATLETLMGPERDRVAELYEELEEWRTVKFVPDSGSSSDAEILGAAHPPDPYSLPSLDGDQSPRPSVSPEGEAT